MAAVSNYPQQPRGPRRLIYSGALGGAVRERTPSVLLCSLTMLNGLRSKTLDARLQIIPRGQAIVPFFASFYFCVTPRPGCRDRNATRSAAIAPARLKEHFLIVLLSFSHTQEVEAIINVAVGRQAFLFIAGRDSLFARLPARLRRPVIC